MFARATAIICLGNLFYVGVTAVNFQHEWKQETLTNTLIVRAQKLLDSNFVAWLDSNVETHNLLRKEVSVDLGWKGINYLDKYC